MGISSRIWFRIFSLTLLFCGLFAPCTSSAQTVNITGEWEYEGTAFAVRQEGTKAYGFLGNNRRIFEGTVSQSTWHGQRLGTGVPNAKGRCPEGERNGWAPFELTLADGGTKMVGKWRATKYAWDQSGPINCWVTGYQWVEMTIYSLTPLPMPESLKEKTTPSTPKPALRSSTDLVTAPEDSHDNGVTDKKPESPYPSRSCIQCGNALLSSLAGKVDILGPNEIRPFLYSARTKYAECIKGTPEGCEHTSVYWKDKRALEGCYYNFPDGGNPLKACILQAIY